MIKKTLAMGAVALGLAYNPAVFARDYISIVGSSTVYPFATTVAEHFGKTGGFKTPKIESTGTGGGIKLFCAGVGVDHPDIVNASRRIKDSEVKACEQNGVTDILEVKIGYDGITITNSKASPEYKLSLKDVYLALAKEIPDPKGGQSVLPNPHKTWKAVNPELPDKKIEVLGPPRPPEHAMPLPSWRWKADARSLIGSKRSRTRTRTSSKPCATPCARTAPISRPVRTTT
jgi:phosphate transport system substrate-binding protein